MSFILSNILGSIFQLGALPIVVLAPLGAVRSSFLVAMQIGVLISPLYRYPSYGMHFLLESYWEMFLADTLSWVRIFLINLNFFSLAYSTC